MGKKGVFALYVGVVGVYGFMVYVCKRKENLSFVFPFCSWKI